MSLPVGTLVMIVRITNMPQMNGRTGTIAHPLQVRQCGAGRMSLRTSKEARESYIAALRLARARIESGYLPFVCLALDRSQASDELRDWISDAIFPARTVGAWLNEAGIKYDSAMARPYRIAWIDHMIRYFEGEA